jgi:nitrite reductase/ring-hydroxylating ferredoxin subunit
MAHTRDESSYWNATAGAPDFPPLRGDIRVDVAIIGGGIVGVTTARLLKDRGQTVAVREARRVGRLPGKPKFVKENLEVGAHLVSGHLARKPKSFDELAPGDAAILKIDGRSVAALRDEQGQVHAVSAVCTHMGCILGWNATDRTWDCPCHGSRFDLGGDVIHGPATKPLGSGSTE